MKRVKINAEIVIYKIKANCKFYAELIEGVFYVCFVP